MGNPNSKKGRSVREQVLADYDWSSDYLKGIAQSQGASTKAERKQGVAFSDTDLMKMDYEYKLTQEERAYNEELYNQYQSPAALMRQYQEAGLNPALMYTDGKSIGAPIASSPTSAQGTGPTGEVDPFTMMSNLISLIQGAAQTGSDVAEKSAHAKLMDTQAKQIESQTIGQNIQNRISSIEAEWLPQFKQLEAANMSADTAKKNADTVLAEESANLAKAGIEKSRAEKALIEIQTSMAKFDESKQQELYNLAVRQQSAQIALTEAQTETEKNEAEKVLQEANLALAKNHEVQRFLYNCGVEAQVEQMETGSELNREQASKASIEGGSAWTSAIETFAWISLFLLSRGKYNKGKILGSLKK